MGHIEGSLFALLLIVVFGPIVAERLRIPALIGLIGGGMLAGPFVLGWLEDGGLVDALGAIGILYLMFVVGLGFDVRAFRENRRNALLYGTVGFLAPFGLGVGLAVGLLDLTPLAGALVGAMWASNTLVALPVVRAAGLQDNQAVTTAVSAGVAADLLSLLVLAIATSSATIAAVPLSGAAGARPEPALPLWLAGPLLLAYALWFLPVVASWFFVEVGHARPQRLVFALAGMAGGAVLATFGGIEGLIGAFLAGLGMNRLVPTEGLLMERLEFVGDVIFVPAFMVSIGLSIDPALLVRPRTLSVAVAFTAVVVVGKTVASLIAGRLGGFSLDEIGLMACLSFGQAASTLAIAQVGSQLGLLPQEVVNGAVLTIATTALLTSYGTRFFAHRVPRVPAKEPALGARVLVDVRPEGSDLDALMRLAGEIARPDDGVVKPYVVTEPGGRARAAELVAEAVERASALGLDTEGLVRVDESFAEGTLHLLEEHDASAVLLSWSGPRLTSYLFGAEIDGLGEQLPVPAIAASVRRPWTRVLVVPGAPRLPWLLDDSRLAVELALRARYGRGMPVTVVSDAPEPFEDLWASHADVEVVAVPGRHVLDVATSRDLVVAPSHLLADMPVLLRRRAVRALADVSVAIVAGPHRLKTTPTPPWLGGLAEVPHRPARAGLGRP
ncbi:MAG TPA: cation:proton antiporter [Actinobacteria bacterium]|nr:cation:proton antiporter [Actinomycetota bacterium]